MELGDKSDKSIIEILTLLGDWQPHIIEEAKMIFKARSLKKKDAKIIAKPYFKNRLTELIGNEFGWNENMELPKSYIFTKREIRILIQEKLEEKIGRIHIFKVDGASYIS